jgi:ParB family transcriptional regulator, chromosome partitioning protein
MSETNKEKRLGKTLEDLLNTNLPEQVAVIQKDANRTRNLIDITLIVPNPFQPRKYFDERKLKELAASIKEHGIFTPILVRPKDKHYEIVTGERRYRAAVMCGLKQVPAIIENFNDNQMMEIALLENVQRDDLTAIDEARAYQNIMDARHFTQQELAKRLGKSRPYLANILRLLTLPSEVQDLVASNQLSMGQARALLGLDEKTMNTMLDKIKNERLSVRQVEQEVRQIKKKKDKNYSQEIKQLESHFKTQVTIDKKQIKISYSDEKELQRLIKKITK